MAGVMARNFSRINADPSIPYVHLSRSHGNINAVRLDKRTAKELGNTSVIGCEMDVKALEARRIVVRAFKAATSSSEWNDCKTLKSWPLESRLHLIFEKFIYLPHIREEDLTGQLASEKGDPIKYFGKAMDILQDGLVKLPEELWINTPPGLEHLRIVERQVGEQKVINYIKRAKKFPLIVSIASGLSTLAFGFTSALALLHHYPSPYATFAITLGWMCSSLAVGNLSLFLGSLSRYGHYSKCLKSFKDPAAQTPAT